MMMPPSTISDPPSRVGGGGGCWNLILARIHYGPQHSVSAMVNSLKGVSRRLLRSARPDLAHQYWKGVLLVTFLLGCNLGRSANQHPQAVHRISKDTDLTESLYIPTLKGEVLRSIG